MELLSKRRMCGVFCHDFLYRREPNDMLAAFFAGSFDPFAGLDLEGDQIDVD